MSRAVFVSLFLLSATVALSKDKVVFPPPAPLPDVVSQARTVMLTSDVGGLAYDEAYKLMREWGRFELTGDPEKADLIFALTLCSSDCGKEFQCGEEPPLP
jgi:hypothetical protein